MRKLASTSFISALSVACAAGGPAPEARRTPATTPSPAPAREAPAEARAPSPAPVAASRATRVATRRAVSAVTPPSGDILLQPQFEWNTGERTANGTAFLTRRDDGRIVVVGSAHYILGEELPVTAQMVSIKLEQLVLETQTALGPVSDGDPATEQSSRDDYFFLPVDADVDPAQVLELDLRDAPEVGEKVWFPDKNFDNGEGFDLRTGEVVEVEPDVIAVRMSDRSKLQSQSGTPFISQKTGLVIGTLIGAYEANGAQVIVLCRGRYIREALDADRPEMPFERAARQELGRLTE